MQLKLFCCFCLIFSVELFFSQEVPREYTKLVQRADSLYKKKEYKKSALTYSKAFKLNSWKGKLSDRYNAACSWALAGYPDSAFFNLLKITYALNYSNYSTIIVDNDLMSLHNDKRWQPLVDSVRANKERVQAKINWPLSNALDSIFKEDQDYRKQIEKVEAEFGRDSKQLKDLWKIISQKDSTNIIFVSDILDKYGWLGPAYVGVKGNEALFLVVQHAELATQEKYLPMIRQAVKEGQAKGASLALLEDRVAIRNGRKQIYGSQVARDKETGAYYVMALEDPDNVDKRRAGVGLGPIADYVAKWKLQWNVVEYKKQLPIYEEKLKNSH